MPDSLDEAFRTLRAALLDARDASLDPRYLEDAIEEIDQVLADRNAQP